MTVQEETLLSESFITGDQLLVTPEEAARRLSLGRTTIYELMSSGELQSVNIGRCRRVPVSSLSLFVTRLINELAVEQPHFPSRQTSETASGYAHRAPLSQPHCDG
jgi:excisionase family DNA binding protein